MSECKEKITLIKTDPKNNNNKFYEVTLGTDDRVISRFGRVGDQGRTVENGRGIHDFNRIVAGKEKRGHKRTAIVGSTSRNVKNNINLKKVSHEQLIANNSDPRLAALVDRLVKLNAHEITTASGGKLTYADGQIQTPLGLLTEDAIQDAKGILHTIKENPRRRESLLSDYMTLVPQNVGRGRDWVETFLATTSEIQRQEVFLSQLADSLSFAEKQNDATGKDATYEKIFRYQITPVDDQDIIDTLTKRYMGSRNTGHGQYLNGLRIKNVYEFRDPTADEIYARRAEELGNTIQAWHGTRAMNLLSIASKGLINPRQGSRLTITGAMFGQGIYASTVSTKALGYSDSGVWSSNRLGTHYLFALDMTLGWMYMPGRSEPNTNNYNAILDGKVADPKYKNRVYNSINVKAGFMGLQNPETIVPDSSQLAIRYMIELSK